MVQHSFIEGLVTSVAEKSNNLFQQLVNETEFLSNPVEPTGNPSSFASTVVEANQDPVTPFRDPSRSTFLNSFDAGVNNLYANSNYFSALLQDLQGDTEAADKSIQRAQGREMTASIAMQDIPPIQEFFAEPTVEGFLTQFVSSMGQFAPSAIASLASAFATGGATAVVGSGARIAAGKGIKNELRRISSKYLTGAPVSNADRIFIQRVYDTMKAHPGLVAGAFGQEFVQGSGIGYGEFARQDMRGAESALRSLGIGVGYGAIGTAGEAAVTQNFLDLARNRFMKGRGSLVKDVFVHGGIRSALGEGTAETLQESISVAQKFRIDPDYDASQAKLDMGAAAFAGFFGGFGMGLGTGSAGAVVGRVSGIGREQMQKAYEKVADRDYFSQMNGFGFEPSGYKTAPEPEAWLLAQVDSLFDESTNAQGLRNIDKPAAYIPFTDAMGPGQAENFLERNGIQKLIDEKKLFRSDLQNGIVLTRRPEVIQKIKDNKLRNVSPGQNAEDLLLKEILGYSAVSTPEDQFVMEVVTNDDKQQTVHYQSYKDEAAYEDTLKAVKKVVPGLSSEGKYRLLKTRNNKPITAEEHLADRARLTSGEREVQIDSYAEDMYEGDGVYDGKPLMLDGRFVEMSLFISEVALKRSRVKKFTKGKRTPESLYFPPRITALQGKKQAFVREVKDRFDTQGTFSQADYANLSALLVERLALVAESKVDSSGQPFASEKERQEEIGRVSAKVGRTLTAIKEEDIGKPKSEVYGKLYDVSDVNNPKNPDNPRNRTGVAWADIVVTPGHLQVMNDALDAINANRPADKKVLAYGRKDPRRRTNFDLKDKNLIGKPLSFFYTDALMDEYRTLIADNPNNNYEIELDMDPDSPTYGNFYITEIGEPTDIGIYTVQQLVNVGIAEGIEIDRKAKLDKKPTSKFFIKGRDSAEHISAARKKQPVGVSLTPLSLRGAQANSYSGLTTQPEATDYKAFDKWILDGFITSLVELDNLGYDIYVQRTTAGKDELIKLQNAMQAVIYNEQGDIDYKNILDDVAPYLKIYEPKKGIGGRKPLTLKWAVGLVGTGPVAQNMREQAKITRRFARLSRTEEDAPKMFIDYRLIFPKAKALEIKQKAGEEITPEELEAAASEQPVFIRNKDQIANASPETEEQVRKELSKSIPYTFPYVEQDQILLNQLQDELPRLRFTESYQRGKDKIRETLLSEGAVGQEVFETTEEGQFTPLKETTPFGREMAEEVYKRVNPNAIQYSDEAVAAEVIKSEKLAFDFEGTSAPQRLQRIISSGNINQVKAEQIKQQKEARLKAGERGRPMEAVTLSESLETRTIPFGESFTSKVQERLSEQVGEKSLAERLYDIAHINFKLDPAMKLVVMAADDNIDKMDAFQEIPMELKKFLKDNQTIVNEVEAEKGRRIRVGDTNVIILRMPKKKKLTDAEFTEVVLVYGHELGHIILDQENYMGNSLSWATPSKQETYKQRLMRAYEEDLKNIQAGTIASNPQWMAENGFEEWWADKGSSFLLDTGLNAKNGGEAIAKQTANRIKNGWSGIDKLLQERFTRNSVGYQEYEKYARNVVRAYREGSKAPRRFNLSVLQKRRIDSMFQESLTGLNKEQRKVAASAYKTVLEWSKDVKNGGIVHPWVRKAIFDTANFMKGIGTRKEVMDHVQDQTGINTSEFGGVGAWATSKLTGISQSRTPQGLQQSVGIRAKSALNAVTDLVAQKTTDSLGREKTIIGDNNPHLLLVEDESISMFKEEKIDTAGFTIEDVKKYEKGLGGEILWVWLDTENSSGKKATAKTNHSFGIDLDNLDISFERLFNASLPYPKIVLLKEDGLKSWQKTQIKKGLAAIPKVTEALPVLNEQGFPIPNIGDGTGGTLTPAAFEARKFSRQFSKDEQLARWGVNIRDNWGFGRQLNWVEIGNNNEIKENLVKLAVKTHKGKQWPIRVYSKKTWDQLKSKKLEDGLTNVRFFAKPVYAETFGESRKVGEHYYRVVQIDEAFVRQTIDSLVLPRPDAASIDSPQAPLPDHNIGPNTVSDPEAKDLSIGLLPERSRLFGKIPTKELRKIEALHDPYLAMDRYFKHTLKNISWRQRGGWQEMLAVVNAVRDMDQKEGDDLKEAIMYSLGNYNGDISAPLRSLNSWGLWLNITTLLAFAVFASFPDFAGPIIRSKEFKAIGNVADVISEYIKDGNGLRQFARDLGVVAQESLETIFVSAADLDWMESRPRLWSAYFFQYTFTEGYTRFMRTFAAGMGRQFVIEHAERAKKGDKDSMRYLAELADEQGDPLTWQTVEKWLKTNYDSKTGKYSFNGPEGRRVRLAIGRFVDESIIRPTALDRPLYANDPRYSLIFQLKTFFYAYGKTVVGGVARESMTRHAEGKPISAVLAPLLLYATTVIPLTMLGWDLRERAKFRLAQLAPGVEPNWKTIGRSHYMDQGDYWLEVFDRTGSFGPWTQLFQMQQSAQWGKFWGTPLIGPSAERVEEFFMGRAKLQDYVPIYSQLPRTEWQ